MPLWWMAIVWSRSLLVIKRVGVDRVANEFVFKSENPNKENYPDFRLNIDEAEGIIVGRVVWVMWGY